MGTNNIITYANRHNLARTPLGGNARATLLPASLTLAHYGKYITINGTAE